MHVCPFGIKSDAESDIARGLFVGIPEMLHVHEAGYYLAGFAGYSCINNQRENAASGGLSTWLLESLLKNNYIDYAVCVSSTGDPEQLFRFSIVSKLEELNRCARSAYYPVELSEVIKFIIKNPGKYAVTALPCFTKALRLAQAKNRKLRERILFIIGLTCGQLKSKHYTSFLAALSGIKAPVIVNFRGKDFNQPANNFYFSCQDANGRSGICYWSQGVADVWVNRWFTPKACDYCDDIFAELADVTFMDAWLPEYVSDSRGTNLVIARNKTILEILKRGKEASQIMLKNKPIKNIIHSQAGLVDYKRNQLSYRLYKAKKEGKPIPSKRVKPNKSLPIHKRLQMHYFEVMRTESRNGWLRVINGQTDEEVFRSRMYNLKRKQRRMIKLVLFISLPVRIFKKVLTITIRRLKA